VEEYVDMVLKKTGGLMMLAFDLMFIFRRETEEKGRFAVLLALF